MRGLEILDDLQTLSDASPRDLTEQQCGHLREMFEDESGLGLYLFTQIICGCKDLDQRLHGEICEFLSKWGKLELEGGSLVDRPPVEGDRILRNWRRLHLCIPRDHFKTSVATRANTLWRLSKDPELTFGIFNESEAKSKSWVGSIKQVIERSELYQAIWKDLLPPGIHFADRGTVPRTWKWGDTGILLQRDALNVSELSIEPFGIGGASTGKHFTHKVLDDIIGEKSAQSEAIMEDAIHWLDHSRPLERPAEGGCELVAYTRWAYHDVYAYGLRKWKGEYQVLHRSALENQHGEPDVVDGTSIFPSRHPTEKLKKMYDDDPFVFYSQYQCIPQAGREVAFNKEWVRRGRLEEYNEEWHFRINHECFSPSIYHPDLEDAEPTSLVPLIAMDRAIILDPAPHTKGERHAERRARNGIVVVGMDCWGRRFHLEGVPLREDPVVVLDKIIQLSKKWGTSRVGIEEVNFSKLYAPLWTQIMYSQYPNVSLEFIPLKTKNQEKDMRIRNLVGPHRQGFFYYNDGFSDHTIQELLEFPNSGTRDLIDALAYTDQILGRPETTEELSKYRRYQREVGRGRDQFTRY